MDDNNLFDEDNVLDFIMQEEVSKQDQRKNGKSGCLGVLVLLILPVVILCFFNVRC